MNKSFKLTIITILVIITGSPWFISCSHGDDDFLRNSPFDTPIWFDFLGTITGNDDNVITSSTQELLLEALYDYDLNWADVSTALLICDNFISYPRQSLEYQQQWEAAEYMEALYGDPIEAEWIRIEVIKDSAPFKLKISVKENMTGLQRAACFFISENTDDGREVSSGRVGIIQKPAVDDTPFKVQLRYKGKLYETEASLNENEELVFQNDEVTELMAMLRAKPGVETVLMDSEIVDFIDEEDFENESRLAALVGRDGMQRVTCPSHPGNWNAGFRFMETGAVGYCALFDDKDFSDSYFVKNLTSRYSVFDVLDMHNISLNDKISSIAIAYEATDNDVCAVLTLWEDDNFNHGDENRSKHRLSLIAAPYNAHAWWSDLKSVPCLGSSKSWNDRASSFSFHFGRVGTQLKDY